MKTILIRFGELTLKGKNINLFIDALYRHTKQKLATLAQSIDRMHDGFLVHYESADETIYAALRQIPGIYSFTRVHVLPLEIKQAVPLIIELLQPLLNKPMTFKIESSRSNKNYPLTSTQYSQALASELLRTIHDPNLQVDVHHPQLTLHCEIGNQSVNFYFGKELGMGGFPVGTAGKGLVLLSGGIDSPVAALLALKQGLNIELLHFESSPLTPLEAVNKAIELSKILAQYTPNNRIKLHVCSLYPLHEAILSKVADSYIITILRRMMYRIAALRLDEIQGDVLINGESLGQVASQTIASMKTVSAVTNHLILRPLITMDKIDIIKIAQQLQTFDISIRPFNDCCSVYVPANPVTRPKVDFCEHQEARFDFQTLVSDCLKSIYTLVIYPDTQIDLSLGGLTFLESIQNLKL